MSDLFKPRSVRESKHVPLLGNGFIRAFNVAMILAIGAVSLVILFAAIVVLGAGR